MGLFDKTQKVRSKTKKVDIIIEFYVFEIVLVTNFSIN